MTTLPTPPPQKLPPILSGSFFSFYRPFSFALTTNATPSHTPNASPIAYNSFIKATSSLCMHTHILNALLPTLHKPTGNSNPSSMTPRHPQPTLLSLTSMSPPTTQIKHNASLILTNTNAPSKPSAKTNLLLPLILLPSNTSSTPFTHVHIHLIHHMLAPLDT